VHRVDEEDVARWYAEHGYTVLRRCLAYLGDLAAAEDAMQEVFVRALDGIRSFRGESSPRTWLCRIADHHCIDVLRRTRRSPVRPIDEHAIDEQEGDVVGFVLEDDRATFLAVCRLMNDLDVDSRRLAVLYFLDELTQEELARELGLSRRTIGKRLKALVERARSLLGEEPTL
jgi:RNA polymerase sigma-70 factor (ECF subfamily)